MSKIADSILNFGNKNMIPFNTEFKTTEIDENKKIANIFISIMAGESSVFYLYSVYNVDTQEKIAQVFLSGQYLIKVSNGEVTEWYEADRDGYDYVSFGKDFHPLEYYEMKDISTFVKKDIKTGEEIVDSTIGSFNSLPLDKQELLKDFEYKKNIFVWSQKFYGFIIEYVEE